MKDVYQKCPWDSNPWGGRGRTQDWEKLSCDAATPKADPHEELSSWDGPSEPYFPQQLLAVGFPGKGCDLG